MVGEKERGREGGRERKERERGKRESETERRVHTPVRLPEH